MGFVLLTTTIYLTDLHHAADLVFLMTFISVVKKSKAFLDCESSLHRHLKCCVKWVLEI